MVFAWAKQSSHSKGVSQINQSICWSSKPWVLYEGADGFCVGLCHRRSAKCPCKVVEQSLGLGLPLTACLQILAVLPDLTMDAKARKNFLDLSVCMQHVSQKESEQVAFLMLLWNTMTKTTHIRKSLFGIIFQRDESINITGKQAWQLNVPILNHKQGAESKLGKRYGFWNVKNSLTDILLPARPHSTNLLN